MQTWTRRRVRSPSFPHPSPHTGGCSQLCTYPSNYILGSTHIPRSRLAALPPSLPRVLCCPKADPAKPPAGTHTQPTWAETGDPSSSSSSASSSTNALGLFLHLSSSRTRRRDPGRHHKVSLSHLCSARPAPGSSEQVEHRRRPGLPGPPRSTLCFSAAELPSRTRWGQSEQAAQGWPATGGLRCCCRPPVPPPAPSLLRCLEAQVGTC